MVFRWLGVATSITAALAACGGGEAPLPIGDTPAPFSFNGTLQLTGELTVSGSFRDSVTLRHESCAEYVRAAAPATTLWVVPTPTPEQSVGGHAVNYTAGVPSTAPSSGYQGPRTYRGASAIVSVLLVDNASFTPGDRSQTSISVAADGSGTMTFNDMVDTATFATESGTVRWTCNG